MSELPPFSNEPANDGESGPEKKELIKLLKKVFNKYKSMYSWLVENDPEKIVSFSPEFFASDGEVGFIAYCPEENEGDVCFFIGLLVRFDGNRIFITRHDETGRARGAFIKYKLNLSTGEIVVFENSGTHRRGVEGFIDFLREETRHPTAGVDEITNPRDFLIRLQEIFDKMKRG